jgi:hypothetical protein
MNNKQNQFMPELADHSDRLQALIEHADSVTNDDYYATLTPEELDLKNEQFSKNAIELNKIEMEKKDVVAGFKERMKPLETVYGNLLETITIGKEKRTGKLFNIKDLETSMMMTYDENGDLVSSRRLGPEEKVHQSKMFIPAGFQKGKAV